MEYLSVYICVDKHREINVETLETYIFELYIVLRVPIDNINIKQNRRKLIHGKDRRAWWKRKRVIIYLIINRADPVGENYMVVGCGLFKINPGTHIPQSISRISAKQFILYITKSKNFIRTINVFSRPKLTLPRFNTLSFSLFSILIPKPNIYLHF